MRFAGVWEPFSPSGRDAEGREGIRLCRLSPHPIPLLKERGMQVSYFKRFNREIIIELRLKVIALTFLLACGQSNSKKNASQTSSTTTSEQVITIDTFSTFPPEIDGCSCCFSNDSTGFGKGEYIYVNDFAQTSFLNINGVLTRFTQTDFKKVDKTTTFAKAKSGHYEMTIEVKNGIQNGDETSLKSGTIKLKDKKR